MARALFKSWFVDFDPVRAKAAVRREHPDWTNAQVSRAACPGLKPEIAELFPDRFVDSELGEIPEGWKIGRLGDIVCQRNERVNPSFETESIPYVPIECISNRSLFLSESKPGSEAKSSLIRFYKNDILFGAMRPYFHKVCIAPFDGTTRTTAFVLYPYKKEDFSFSIMLLHDKNTIDYATRHSTGSTIPYAQWIDSLADMPIILPSINLRAQFDKMAQSFFYSIPYKYFENRTLTALRDTLLPKLISGEIRIKDAERFLNERRI